MYDYDYQLLHKGSRILQYINSLSIAVKNDPESEEWQEEQIFRKEA